MLLLEEGAYFPDLIFVNRFDEFFMCGLVRSPTPSMLAHNIACNRLNITETVLIDSTMIFLQNTHTANISFTRKLR